MSILNKNELGKFLKAYASEPDPIYHGMFRRLGVVPGVVFFDRAQIASKLGPRAMENLTESSSFCVVGYDCPNMAKEYGKWQEFLVDVCKKGCCFTYYLGKKDIKGVFDRFDEIAKSSHAKRGQIKVFVRSRIGSKQAETLANQWKRFHFAIFEKPRQLWIEVDHPEGVTEASECYYFPPKIAEKEPLLDICKSRFETVVNECASLEFES